MSCFFDDSPWFSRFFDFCPRSWSRSSASKMRVVHRWFFRKSRPTSGGRNFCASGGNCTKPPPNENISSELSFGGGFVQFRLLARKLRPPEVAHLGGPCGACTCTYIPSGSPKICSNFTKSGLTKRIFHLWVWFLCQTKALSLYFHLAPVLRDSHHYRLSYSLWKSVSDFQKMWIFLKIFH